MIGYKTPWFVKPSLPSSRNGSDTVNRYKLQPARHPPIPSGAVFTVVL